MDRSTWTVAELIEHLKTFPQDAPIGIYDVEGVVDIDKSHVYMTKKKIVLFHPTPRHHRKKPEPCIVFTGKGVMDSRKMIP